MELKPILNVAYIHSEDSAKLEPWNIYPPDMPVKQIVYDADALVGDPDPVVVPIEEDSPLFRQIIKSFRAASVREAVEYAANTGWLPETWCDMEGSVSVPTYLVERANAALLASGASPRLVQTLDEDGAPDALGRYEAACRSWLAANPALAK